MDDPASVARRYLPLVADALALAPTGAFVSMHAPASWEAAAISLSSPPPPHLDGPRRSSRSFAHSAS